MSEHATPRDSAPDPAELALRKALGTMNDLEPPRDDLFVQRALLRGRAATARRRSALLGAAAAIVVVGSAGGTWYAANHGLSSTTASTAGQASDSEAKAGAGTAGGGTGSAYSNGGGAPAVPRGPVVAPQSASSVWFEGPSTPVTLAFDTVWPSIVSRWPDTFSGAYTTDATNTHLVVAETQPNPALEAAVRAGMPSPSAVEFTTATHSFADKEQVAQQVVADTASWRTQGVQVFSVRQDGRADQVVVAADEGSTPGVIAQHYGDIVRVVPATAASSVAPNGSTLPNLHP